MRDAVGAGKPWWSRWLTTAAGGCIGAGLVLLLAAVVIGRFSWSWATTSQLPPVNLGWDSGTPGFAAGLAIVMGLLVLVALAVALAWRAWIAAVCVAAFAVLVLLACHNILRYHTVMTTAYLAAQQVPSALAAWLFATTGALATVTGAVVFVGSPRAVRWGSVGTGAVAAAVVVVVTTAVVMRDADPNRYFDGTTAADAEPPAIPAALGATQRFAVEVDGYAVHAAGVGFVVRTADGVRAFDSTGQQRWHYLHNGEPRWNAEFLGVFDDGATVVVGLDSGAHMAGEIVGLDAVTGKLLWRSDDMRLVLTVEDLAAPDRVSTDRPFYLVVTNGPGVSRIDTRTGKELWQKEIPYPDRYVPFDTHAGIGYFRGNGQTRDGKMRYVSLDPQTGAVRFDIPVGTHPWDETDTRGLPAGIDPVRAGRDGMVFTDGDRQRRYFNGVTGVVSPFDGGELLGPASGDGFLAQLPGSGAVTIRNAQDGRIRCSIATEGATESAGWLGDEVVLGHRDGVSAYRRSDCSPAAELPVPGGDIVVVPGALLTVDPREGSVKVTGYA